MPMYSNIILDITDMGLQTTYALTTNAAFIAAIGGKDVPYVVQSLFTEMIHQVVDVIDPELHLFWRNTEMLPQWDRLIAISDKEHDPVLGPLIKQIQRNISAGLWMLLRDYDVFNHTVVVSVLSVNMNTIVIRTQRNVA